VMQIGRSYSGTNVTVLADNHRVVYYADYYNDVTKSLNGVVVIRLDESGGMLQRIDADWAQWDNDRWMFHRSRVYSWNDDRSDLIARQLERFSDATLVEPPTTFGRGMRDVSEMTGSEAREHIRSLRTAGIPFRGALTAYYERFTFALTPLVVAALSSAIGGRFKRNILLMSLLVSLSLAVLYYVTGMVTGLMAQSGVLPPFVGASIPIALFLAATGFLFHRSRT
jgi:lipopolysaccharide export system permease protein